MIDQSENLPIPETENSELAKTLKNLEQLVDTPNPDPEIIDALDQTFSDK